MTLIWNEKKEGGKKRDKIACDHEIWTSGKCNGSFVKEKKYANMKKRTSMNFVEKIVKVGIGIFEKIKLLQFVWHLCFKVSWKLGTKRSIKKKTCILTPELDKVKKGWILSKLHKILRD